MFSNPRLNAFGEPSHARQQDLKAVPMKKISPPSMKMFFSLLPAPCSLLPLSRQRAFLLV